MKNYLIKALGGYTVEDVKLIEAVSDSHFDYAMKLDSLTQVFENFFLDTIQGKNRDAKGKFCTRDSLGDYFLWCHTYGQMPHKKLANAFMRYERSLSKVKSVKRTSEA